MTSAGDSLIITQAGTLPEVSERDGCSLITQSCFQASALMETIRLVAVGDENGIPTIIEE